MEWPVARMRTAGVMADHKNWRNVILISTQTGEEIWDMRAIAAKPMRPVVADFLKTTKQITNLSQGKRPDCPCILVHEAVPKFCPPRFLLSAELSPLDLQRNRHRILAREGARIALQFPIAADAPKT